jgi:hypothetical protein
LVHHVLAPDWTIGIHEEYVLAVTDPSSPNQGVQHYTVNREHNQANRGKWQKKKRNREKNDQSDRIANFPH